MPAEDPYAVAALTGAQSRRAALHTGGALLAGMGALAFQRSTTAQATPTADAPGGGLLLVQSFSRGTLFPTQGDAGGAPYTVIVWDAADRGFFYADCAAAAAWLGTEPATLPEGPQDLGLGFLILSGISGFDTGDGVRLNLT